MRDYEVHHIKGFNRTIDTQLRLAIRQFKFRHVTARFYIASMLFCAIPPIVFTYLVDSPTRYTQWDICSANAISVAVGTSIACPMIRRPLNNLISRTKMKSFNYTMRTIGSRAFCFGLLPLATTMLYKGIRSIIGYNSIKTGDNNNN